MTREITSRGVGAWQRARDRQPSRGLRWASWLEARPARHWLGLQWLALLPASAALLRQVAASWPPLATALLGAGWLLVLGTVCLGGRQPLHWAARAPRLGAAALATLLASAAAWPPNTSTAGQAMAVALLMLGAASSARSAFSRPGPSGPPWPQHRIAHPTRRFVQHAVQRLQRAAWCKCAYGATLIASALAGMAAALRG